MTKDIIESYLDKSRLQKRVPEYIRIFMGADALTASLYDDENLALYRPQRDFTMIEPSESSVFLQNEETHSTPSFYEIEKSAGTELVGMDEYGSIAVVSGEKKKIATYGLGVVRLWLWFLNLPTVRSEGIYSTILR